MVIFYHLIILPLKSYFQFTATTTKKIKKNHSHHMYDEHFSKGYTLYLQERGAERHHPILPSAPFERVHRTRAADLHNWECKSSVKKHRHRRNVTSYHLFSLLWLFQLLSSQDKYYQLKTFHKSITFIIFIFIFFICFIFLVLGKLGPGQLGPGQLGPRHDICQIFYTSTFLQFWKFTQKNA